MIKRGILMAVAVVALAGSAGAQDVQISWDGRPDGRTRNAVGCRHEFFAGTGVLPMHDLSAIPRQIAALLTFGAVEPLESNLRFKPSAAVGYKYRFERVVSLGATFSYSGNTADSKLIWEDEKCRLNRDYYALAAEVEVRYLTREHVTLYGTVGLGAAYQHAVRSVGRNSDSMRRTIFTAYMSEIGVKAGGHRFGGFLECGFGYKGVVNFGVYSRF